jgi:type II secretory pathway component PulF
LLDAGIPTVESLQLSTESLNNSILRDRLVKVEEEASSGTRLGPSFRMHWPYPPLLSQAVITGEAAGALSEALHGLADYYEQEATRSVNAATELIQPAVIVLVALLV